MKTLRILLISLLFTGICLSGPNKVLDLVLNGNFTNILGSELVTNGTFDTDTTGWTADDQAVLSVDTNRLKVENGGAEAGDGRQAITTVVGKKYLATATLTDGSAPARFFGGTSINSSDLFEFSDGYASATNVSVIFTATTTTSHLRFSPSSTTVGHTMFADNVSVKEVLSPWIPGAEWSFDNTAANWLSDGSDTTLSQPTIALVDGNTYKVGFTVTNTSFAAGDTYIGIQLGGGTALQITEDGTYTIYLVCGNSPSSGLEITAVNGTAADTMTFDDISIIVEQFTPSTNLESVYVSGNIRVPAGADLVSNGDFTTDTTGWIANDGAVLSVDTGRLKVTNGIGSAGDGYQIVTTVAGKTYLATATIQDGDVTARFLGGKSAADNAYFVFAAGYATPTTLSAIFIADTTTTYIRFSPNSSTVDKFMFADDVSVFELTTGPIDEYPSSGTQGGQVKYTSAGTHADGAGGAAQAWDLWWDGSTKWIISLTAGSTGTNYWSRTNADPIGDYVVNGNVTGTATITYGPTDHFIATGSPAMETDGVAGYIELKTSYGFLNDLRTDKFAVVNVYSTSGGTLFERILSAESSNNVGVRTHVHNAINTITVAWNGTDDLLAVISAQDNELHSFLLTADIANTSAWTGVDGTVTVDSLVSVLDAGDNTLVALGASAHNMSLNSNTKFAFTAILDLSSVATVDAAWSTGLSVAINNAGTDATDIANAIFAYDANITGIYWPLNEARANDVSDYYGLAYDITDNSAKTSEFYLLVSPAGVTGTSIGAGGGRYNGGSIRDRYEGFYRSRYSPN